MRDPGILQKLENRFSEFGFNFPLHMNAEFLHQNLTSRTKIYTCGPNHLSTTSEIVQEFHPPIPARPHLCPTHMLATILMLSGTFDWLASGGQLIKGLLALTSVVINFSGRKLIIDKVTSQILLAQKGVRQVWGHASLGDFKIKVSWNVIFCHLRGDFFIILTKSTEW